MASSAGFGNALPKQISFRIFLITGVDDFNHDELYRLSRELARRNVPHRYVEFEGGHEWLPPSLADASASEWKPPSNNISMKNDIPQRSFSPGLIGCILNAG